MIKTLLQQVKEYKAASLLTPLFTGLEVLMEVLIPFVTASIIDKGIEAGDMGQVYLYGGLMLVLALISLAAGILAGRFGAKASSGFACNLRDAMYEKIQTYSFSNIDKFSTAGPVTRMTTDVTNLQNAYQMCLRIAVRAPLMLLCSMVMCFFISPRLSSIFLVAVVVLAAALVLIMSKATRIFNQVFEKYDDLNASVQENVAAIRVVKAYVREDYENQKFQKATGNLYRLFVKAEGILAVNNPPDDAHRLRLHHRRLLAGSPLCGGRVHDHRQHHFPLQLHHVRHDVPDDALHDLRHGVHEFRQHPPDLRGARRAAGAAHPRDSGCGGEGREHRL